MLYTICEKCHKISSSLVPLTISMSPLASDAAVTPSYQDTKTSELAYAVNMGLSPK